MSTACACHTFSVVVADVNSPAFLFFFFFNDTATTEIYTLSLHDALPISGCNHRTLPRCTTPEPTVALRSEEHTSELQSHHDLVCRLLLEKKNCVPEHNRRP